MRTGHKETRKQIRKMQRAAKKEYAKLAPPTQVGGWSGPKMTQLASGMIVPEKRSERVKYLRAIAMVEGYKGLEDAK
jgi:hypothetical protein